MTAIEKFDELMAVCISPRECARLTNLCDDRRDDISSNFFRHIAQDCDLSEVFLDADTAWCRLREYVRPPESVWLGRFTSDVFLEKGYTFLSLDDIRNYCVDTTIVGEPRRIILDKPLKFSLEASLPIKRFIWVTDQAFDEDPTEIVRELGLPHYREGTVLYRVELTLKDRTLYRPSCCDAEFYEAWSYPHGRESEKTGYTRDTATGELRHREVLTESADHAVVGSIAERIGEAHNCRVQPYEVDFMVARSEDAMSAFRDELQ